MPTTIRWRGTATPVAQVNTGSIDSLDATPSNNVFTVTIGGVAISQIGITNVGTTAGALVVLLNASTHPYFAAVTWTNPSGGTIVGTADQAGIPFIAALTETGVGTGAVTDFAATVANAGPNVVSTLANYSPAQLPVTGDTLIIENGASPMMWDLEALSGVTLAVRRVANSYVGFIGLDENNFVTEVDGTSETPADPPKPEYRPTKLKVGVTLDLIGETFGAAAGDGSGRLLFDYGSVQTAITVYSTATTSRDGTLQPLRFIGTHASNTLRVITGTVGVATTAATEVATIASFWQEGGSTTFGPGVTHAGGTVSGGVANFKNCGTSATFDCTSSTVTIDGASGSVAEVDARSGSTVYTKGGFTITQVYVWGGTFIPAAGTISDIVVYLNGSVDMSAVAKPFTVSAASISYGGGSYRTSPLVTLTTDIKLAVATAAGTSVSAEWSIV